MDGERTYLIQRSSISKDEINGTFDVALLEVIPSRVIMKGILRSEEPTTPEGRLITSNPNCRSLAPVNTRMWYWSYILGFKDIEELVTCNVELLDNFNNSNCMCFNYITMKLMFLAMKLAPKMVTEAL